MNYNKLKGKLVESNITYKECADHLNISLTAFCNKINGKSKFSLDEIRLIADFTKMTIEEKLEIFLN